MPVYTIYRVTKIVTPSFLFFFFSETLLVFILLSPDSSLKMCHFFSQLFSVTFYFFDNKKPGSRPMSLSYHRQADLAFAQKQVEEFSSACFLFLPNTNRQIFICLKKLYSLIQIYATLYKKP